MTTERLALFAVVILGVVLFVMAPAIAAYAMRHPERRRIAALSPLTALSFLLWGALMVWAIGGKRDDSVIGRFVEDQRGRLKWVVVALVVGGVAMGAYAWSQRPPTAATAVSGSSLNSPSMPVAR